MILALIICGSIAAYLFIAGCMGGTMYSDALASCHKCSNGQDTFCYAEHTLTPVFSAAFWPLTLPIIGGMLWSTRHERKIAGNDKARAKMLADVARIEKELNIAR